MEPNELERIRVKQYGGICSIMAKGNLAAGYRLYLCLFLFGNARITFGKSRALVTREEALKANLTVIKFLSPKKEELFAIFRHHKELSEAAIRAGYTQGDTEIIMKARNRFLKKNPDKTDIYFMENFYYRKDNTVQPIEEKGTHLKEYV